MKVQSNEINGIYSDHHNDKPSQLEATAIFAKTHTTNVQSNVALTSIERSAFTLMESRMCGLLAVDMGFKDQEAVSDHTLQQQSINSSVKPFRRGGRQVNCKTSIAFRLRIQRSFFERGLK